MDIVIDSDTVAVPDLVNDGVMVRLFDSVADGVLVGDLVAVEV